MSNALERLAEIVRQAESKTRAQKLGTEARQAADRLVSAEARMRLADQHLQEIRPIRQHELEKADADEIMLRDLEKKLAHSLANLEPEHQRIAEREIVVAREEIAESRRVARTELDATLKEADAARRELRTAREQFLGLRREIDQIMPELADDFAEEDRLLRQTESYFPAGMIQALAREIDDGEHHFIMLDQREQFAQLKIWIGRFRRLQSWAESEDARLAGLTEDDHGQLREIFPRLVGISKKHMPGYIEAFSRAFETDWDAYVADAAEQLRLATETGRRQRELRRQAAGAAAGTGEPGAGNNNHQTLGFPGEDWRGQLPELLTTSRGQQAFLVGGEPDEDLCHQLERLFEFDTLEWVSDKALGTTGSLSESIHSRGVDLVLVLTEFVGQDSIDSLHSLCAEYDVPCLEVDHGVGPAQLADALRNSLTRPDAATLNHHAGGGDSQASA